jgi:hypothetical protein
MILLNEPDAECFMAGKQSTAQRIGYLPRDVFPLPFFANPL